MGGAIIPSKEPAAPVGGRQSLPPGGSKLATARSPADKAATADVRPGGGIAPVLWQNFRLTIL